MHLDANFVQFKCQKCQICVIYENLDWQEYNKGYKQTSAFVYLQYDNQTEVYMMQA